MMCDNLSLYKTYIPSPTSLPPAQSTTISPQFYPIDNDDNEHRPYMSIKRKLSGIYSIQSDYRYDLSFLKLSLTDILSSNSLEWLENNNDLLAFSADFIIEDNNRV